MQYIYEQPAPVGEPAALVFTQVNAAEDADGYGNDRGYQYDQNAAEQRIGNASSCFAYRFGNVGKEVPVDLTGSGLDDVNKYGNKWYYTGKG